MHKEVVLQVKEMSKNFGGTRALHKVDLDFFPGEIRGLVGENGSGKSTVTSIISGMQKASSGKMYFKGEEWNPDTMVQAQRNGISMVLQEANTIPNCSVAENIFAGRLDEFTQFGFLNRSKLNKDANELLVKHGVKHIKAEDSINQYNFEDRKLIEIVRCVDDNTEILVVDETTTALCHEGRELLFSLINKMKDNNKTIIFISHDLDEIMTQCTALTVLRDGDIIGSLEGDELKKEGAVEVIRYMMVGREIGNDFYRNDFEATCEKEVALSFKNVYVNGVEDFSLDVRKGEIVGIGGLSGSGMHDIGKAAFGIERVSSGTIETYGHAITTPLEAVGCSMGYISKNRDKEALILEGSIKDNIVLPSLSKLSKGSYISPVSEKRVCNKEMGAFRIKAANGNQWVNTLSGGNKQKVSFAKWTAKDVEILIMDCPTRGVDVGVKKEMYQLIHEMKKQGKAILMISEELAELIGMADRLLILKDHKISKEFERSETLTESMIIEHMI